MEDDAQNLNPSGGNNPAKKPLSPWDEELPPDEPKKPNVVGSLDARPGNFATTGADKKPVPFNIPTDVGEEKVGKKIPAQAVIAQKAVPVAPKSVSLPKQNIAPKTEAVPIVKQAANIPAPKPTVPLGEAPTKPAPNSVAKPLSTSPVTNIFQPPAEAKTTSIPIVNAEKPVVAEKTVALSPIKTAPPAAAATPKMKQPSGAGVSELIQDKAKPAISQSQAPKPVAAPKPVEDKFAMPKKPDAFRVPIYPTPVAKLEPESGALADIKPVEKNLETEKETPPPILPNISKPINILEDENLSTNNQSLPRPKEKIKEPPKPPPEIRKPVKNNEPPFYKKAKFLIPLTLVMMFVLGTFLTEAGIISIGLEKIYGLTGVEALWGGLPRNPEKALGISAQTMQKQLNFKIKGTVSMTVNKTIKSQVTSPLVSSVNLPFAFRDTNISSGIKAITTQYDYYGDNTSSSTSTNSSTSTSTPATTDTSSTATSTTSTDNSLLGDQSSSASYVPEESTIKQVDADIEGQSSDQAIKTDLIIKKLVGSGSTVSLLSTKNQLFVKSSQDIKFATNADSSKWLEFNIGKIENENPFKDFTNIKLDQGFSIIGRRSGNEKIDKTRCFKYTIDNLEIGDSLDFLGIAKDSVQKIEGNIWIGVADHYIHKIDLKIIPSISSSISQMNVTLEMYDYGIENSIQIPSLDEKVVASVTVDPNATSTTTTTTTTTPSIASAVTLEQRDQTRKSDLQSIKAALEKYKTANGKFPVANSLIHLDTKDNVVQKALVAEYIASIPGDPKASEGWFYGYQSNGNKFTLSARLENPADKQVTKVGDIYLHWVYNN